MEHLKAVSVEWLFACLNNSALIDLEDFVRSPVYDKSDKQTCRKENIVITANLSHSKGRTKMHKTSSIKTL